MMQGNSPYPMSIQNALLEFNEAIQSHQSSLTDFCMGVLESLEHIFPNDMSIYIPFGGDKPCAPLTLLPGFDLSRWDLYSGKYFRNDPFFHNNLPYLLKNQRILMSSDVRTQERDFLSAPYFQYRMQDNISDQVTMQILINDQLCGCYTTLRFGKDVHFSPADRQLFTSLASIITGQQKPIIERSERDATIRSLVSVLDQEQDGVFLLNEQFLPTHVNKTGLALISSLTSEGSLEQRILEFLSNHVFDKFNYGSQVIGTVQDTFQFTFSSVFTQPLQNQLPSINYILRISHQRSEPVVIPVMKEPLSAYHLTNRETEILKMIMDGCRNQEITEKLFISLPTCKTHISNIYKKLGVAHRMKKKKKMQTISMD